jgi:hypothetical protein
VRTLCAPELDLVSLSLNASGNENLVAAGPVSRILSGCFLQIIGFTRVTRKVLRDMDFD